MIDKIKVSKVENRKELLQKFVSYHNKVDGAISEAYSYFADEYPRENTYKFFSVMDANDEKLLNEWFEISKSELLINLDGAEEMDKLQLKFLPKKTQEVEKLNEIQKELLNKYTQWVDLFLDENKG